MYLNKNKYPPTAKWRFKPNKILPNSSYPLLSRAEDKILTVPGGIGQDLKKSLSSPLMADCYLPVLQTYAELCISPAGGNKVIMHKSVLLQETIELLAPKRGGVYIDATTGAGGHTIEIARLAGDEGRVLAIDQDEKAIDLAKKRLIGLNVTFAKGNFADILKIAKENGFLGADGILADIGVSSMQLDESERGFSFSKKAKLDMRMDQTQELTAEIVVNTYSEQELTKIFREYGEEQMAKAVAREIVKTREHDQTIWTDQLSEVVRRVKRGIRNSKFEIRNSKRIRIDPATKVFQALRIEVNQELNALESALPQMVEVLKGGGRMAIISFHSLEDRIVKQFIDSRSKTCTCPPEFPKCVCDTVPELKKITKKPVIATQQEISENPRSRSAKLRVSEKI